MATDVTTRGMGVARDELVMEDTVVDVTLACCWGSVMILEMEPLVLEGARGARKSACTELDLPLCEGELEPDPG